MYTLGMNIDELIYAAVFSDENAKKKARAEIRRLAQEKVNHYDL